MALLHVCKLSTFATITSYDELARGNPPSLTFLHCSRDIQVYSAYEHAVKIRYRRNTKVRFRRAWMAPVLTDWCESPGRSDCLRNTGSWSGEFFNSWSQLYLPSQQKLWAAELGAFQWLFPISLLHISALHCRIESTTIDHWISINLPIPLYIIKIHTAGEKDSTLNHQ